ncbi:MAG TPA: ABA4-like family protein [Polyangia bacterium]
METTFEISNFLVTPFWLAMILAPGWRWTRRLMATPVGALAPALIYLALVLPQLPAVLPVVARPDLASVSALLASPTGTTLAWVHFLAFDLLVGRWIYLDARARGISAWATSPLLILTLLLGPLGLLGYAMVRLARSERMRGLLAKAPANTGPLLGLLVGSLGLLAISLLLPLWDARQVVGASVWSKPAKFAASVILLAGSLIWLMPSLQPLTRGMRRSVALIAWLVGLELVLITMQSIRGVPSHFNNATLFDGAVFTVMGIAIAVVWFALAHLAWRSCRQPFDDRALGWGVRLGFLTLLLGAGLGGAMPPPTAEQRAAIASGSRPALVGAHTVGGPDGDPVLPVVGWSRTGGDLRVPHFVGIHGLQILPLFALWIGRRSSKRRGPVEGAALAVRLVVIAGVGYGGLIVATLVQALRAQPVLQPDLGTWLSLGVLLGGTALAASVAVIQGRRLERAPANSRLPETQTATA